MQTLVAPMGSWQSVVDVAADVALVPIRRSHSLSLLLHLPQAQALLEVVGQTRGRAVFRRAVRSCPAYRQFVSESEDVNGIAPPVTTKENYVLRYGIAARCYGGTLPTRGAVIDESSGSSGTPNQWVRSGAERQETARGIRAAFRHVYPEAGRIILNCFALGPWATGMTVSLALADGGILKSLGADMSKLENTLRAFGPSYRYLVCGYPPFIKNFLATADLDLSGYHLDLVVGGEGLSEATRSHFLPCFRTVLSSYGASDLEINIGLETPRTLSLRRACADDPGLCHGLFGRDTPPMLFQYNPLDYVIETLDTGELAFTLTRRSAAAPKIRYNLRDLGGCLPWREMEARLRQLGRGDLTGKQGERHSAFPLLWLWGRSDCSVPFCGAKVFPSDLESVLASDDALRFVSSFQLGGDADKPGLHRLHLALELAEGVDDLPLHALTDIQRRLFNGLRRVNQDFREVTRLQSANCLNIVLHSCGSGPFAGRDTRIKNQYLAAG